MLNVPAQRVVFAVIVIPAVGFLQDTADSLVVAVFSASCAELHAAGIRNRTVNGIRRNIACSLLGQLCFCEPFGKV